MSLWGLLPLLLDEKRKSATFLSRAIITGDQGTFERKYKLYKTQHLEKELKMILAKFLRTLLYNFCSFWRFTLQRDQKLLADYCKELVQFGGP